MNDPKELYFLSLGGAGQFGVNLNLYGYDDKWLMVDCGMGFGDGVRPGVEIVLPNPRFIVERKKNLVGLLITHAHEDHIGAIAHLWPQLRCPIYATPFTAALIRSKLIERELTQQVPIILVEPGGHVSLPPFEIDYVRMTHSTLEPALLAIKTPAGTIIHTGDWKLDAGPVLGAVTDEEKLRQLGEEGVLALIGDSTNALTPGHSGSEAALADSLVEIFSRFKQRIAVTCFSSNVARLASIQRAAAANNRQTALVGRSLWRTEEAARNCGYLDHIPKFLTEHEAGFVPRENIVMICTGSQGEPRSALARISDDDHPHIVLDEGDTVIFSARAIPGNEKAITNVQNNLAKQGIDVVTADEAFVHVSGHPAQQELVTLYQWLRPRIAIPTHGEYPHLAEHAKIARSCQVAETIVPENGALIRLAPGPAEVVDHVEAGLLALDGKRIMGLDAASLRTRQRISFDGAVVVSLALDRKGRLLADPVASAPGLLARDENQAALADLELAIAKALDDLTLEALRNDEQVREAARLAVRRHVTTTAGKKPWIEISLMRI